MKTRLCMTTVAAIVAVALGATDFVFGAGRGGGGGGGGGGRGGGGGGAPARPAGGSSPSLNRPSDGGAARSAAPARPSTGTGVKPNGGGGNVATGNRPSLQPGTQPNVAAGAGARPATLPSNRPGIGSGQGVATGAAVTSRPAAGVAKTTGNLPGVSQQPARLPGLGQAGAGTRLPNQGAGLQDRPQSLQDRQSSLNDRMASTRDDRQGNRQNMQNDRQDYRTGNREDWQNFADDHHNQYGDWYHDSWHPGAGWNQMWDNYPVAAAFGVTAWGVNRMAYGMGYWGYSNPYSGGSGSYNYSQPLVAYSDGGTTTTPADPAGTAATSQSETADAGTTAFNDARDAFYNGDAAKALTLLDITLKTMPNDTVVHEFRGLVLFALKKYSESAAAIYAVLSAGPGWDWTTMSSLYPTVGAYTQQLRALEDFTKANPNSADAHFLLGYHYLTGTHTESALKQFQLAQKQLPDDKLIAQLIGMTTPPDESKTKDVATPPAPQSVAPEKVLTAEKLVGQWKASSQGASFQLELAKDGSFVWTYSRGKDTQTVKGVFAVDQNNLALEPDAGGTMLAEVNLTNPSQFVFKMIGGQANDPGLQFKKI